MSVLADRRWVVFVNVSVPRQWEGPNNTVLAEGVARYPHAALVDWHAASAGQREYFAKDGYHLQPVGQRVFTAAINEKLKELAALP
jgi:lysophospholipase L1-like esterase